MNVPTHPRFRDRDGPTIDAAAERLEISATAIEKDYWVSEVLRVMATEFAEDFILKGGTSLSKGYRLIQRFSEDIDILVLPGGRGRGATDKLMKRMSESAAAGIGGTASAVAQRPMRCPRDPIPTPTQRSYDPISMSNPGEYQRTASTCWARSQASADVHHLDTQRP